MAAKTLLTFCNGAVRFIHDDKLTAALKARLQPTTTHIQRASHVEAHPDGSAWYADMGPVGGPVLDGFPDRGSALSAEVQFLQEHVLRRPSLNLSTLTPS